MQLTLPWGRAHIDAMATVIYRLADQAADAASRARSDVVYQIACRRQLALIKRAREIERMEPGS